MKQSDKDFLIRVKADITEAVGDLKKVSTEMKKSGDQGKRSSKGIDQMSGSMRTLITVAKVYIALKLAQSVVRQADAFNVLQTRIKTATKATGDYVAISKQLNDISRDNGTALETSVALFQSIARAAPELNASNQEILSLVNSVQQLGIVSGASKANLQAGLLQFSQGLSSGVFRAEEFNSLLENIPEVANRIAEGMGKTVGQLRQAVIDGEVLSKDVFDSLLKQAGDINDEFKSIPDSVERSETRFVNSWSRMLSAVDEKLHLTDFYRYLVNNQAALNNAVADFFSEADASSFSREIDDAIFHISDLVQKMGELKSLDIKNAFDLIAQNIEAAQSKMEEIYNTTPDVIESKEELERLDNLSQQIDELKKQRQILIDALKNISEDDKQIDIKPDKAITAINKIIDALQAQLDTFGLTNEEMAIYQLHLQGASVDELSLAAAMVRRIQAMQDSQRTQEEGKKVFEETRTEAEKLSQEMDRLGELFRRGAIDWDTYNRAVSALESDLEDLAASDVWDDLSEAVDGWGRETAGALADMTQTGEDLWRELAESIINQILRILFYQSLIQPLMGSLGIGGSGGAGGTGNVGFGSGYVPTNHSGGMAGKGGSSRLMPLSGFIGAPRFHGGRIPGLRSNEIPAILEDDEEVLTSNDPRHINNLRNTPQNIKVEVTNKGGNKQAADVSVNHQGKDLVVGLILDDVQTGGPVSRSFQKIFNLNRSGR